MSLFVDPDRLQADFDALSAIGATTGEAQKGSNPREEGQPSRRCPCDHRRTIVS